MKLAIFTRWAAVAALLVFAAGVQAGTPITFDFTFQATPPGTAKAVGSITFADRDVFASPHNNDLPYSSVTALNVTVSGASSGNGTFTRSDFDHINLDTGGFILDVTKQLVGQPTNGSAWGTPGGCGLNPGPADAGDFNLFTSVSGAPEGVDCFTLAAGAVGGDQMFLTSMIAEDATAPVASVPVPANRPWALLLLALLTGLGAAYQLRRYARAR